MTNPGGIRSVDRGEIYWIDWEPHRGSEQAGHRPGLVISTRRFNENFRVCTVLALTTKQKISPAVVHLPARYTGKESWILPWQLMTVSVERLEDLKGRVDKPIMDQVDQRLKLIWGL